MYSVHTCTYNNVFTTTYYSDIIHYIVFTIMNVYYSRSPSRKQISIILLTGKLSTDQGLNNSLNFTIILNTEQVHVIKIFVI